MLLFDYDLYITGLMFCSFGSRHSKRFALRFSIPIWIFGKLFFSLRCVSDSLSKSICLCIFSARYHSTYYDLLTLLAHRNVLYFRLHRLSWYGRARAPMPSVDTINISHCLFLFIFFSIRTPVIDWSLCTNKHNTQQQ